MFIDLGLPLLPAYSEIAMDVDENAIVSANLPLATLGDIAVRLPGATAIFRELNLDYCCGGQVTLEAAASSAGIDLDEIIARLLELESADAPPSESAALDTSSLIDLIVTRYHRVHSQELPELIRLAERVEEVHRGHISVPIGLALLLRTMLGELTVHMQKEELILFPHMRQGVMEGIGQPIAVMMSEHVAHGAQIEKLKAMTGNFQPPDDGCATWRALYAGLAKFEGDLIEHIHTENNILFPRFMSGDVGP